MTTMGQIRAIEKRLRGRGLESRVRFFYGDEEFARAKKNGEIKEGDICIIDNIPEDDEE